MARRGHTKDGNVHCSGCGSVTEPDMTRCEQCGEALDGDFNAMVCPYCATVVEADSGSCSSCGLKFVTEKESRSKEDDEFLTKLLAWGKKLEAKRIQEDRMETDKATSILKDVMGVSAATPLQEETIMQIKKSAEEREEFERREDSIQQMAQPLRKALDLRKESLDELERKYKGLQAELRGLSEEDLDSEKKRSNIERQLAEITVERNSIQRLEENIGNMDQAYRQLLKRHSAEIKEKEENLNERLKAFKGEMERREKEKERLKAREDFLENKEKELTARIESLKERESSLRRTEERMRHEIVALETERKGLGELKAPVSGIRVAKGKWMVDSEELASVLRRSKKLRDDWLEEQRKIQESIAVGEGGAQVVAETEARIEGKEEELKLKIQELESRLARAAAEERSIAAEEREVVSDINKLKKVLKVLDDLLENLPDDVVARFAKTKDYREYEELMDELGL